MRKKNVKKMLSVMLLVSLVILSVAGCSGTKNEDSSKDAGVSPIRPEPIQDLRTGKTVRCRWKLPSRSMPSTL